MPIVYRLVKGSALTNAELDGNFQHLQDGLDAVDSQIQAAIDALIGGAPGALDTLNELAAALNDDANFSATVTNQLALKAPLESPTFTGTVGGITKSMVGLGNVDNTSDAAKPVSTAQATAIAAAAATVQADVDAHEARADNPHSVTKTQVGLGNVDNTSDANKPVSTAQAAAIAVVQNDVDAHEARADNPHSVTKTQVGLSNVDNTSDANKPISTATQTALDLKASISSSTGAMQVPGGTTAQRYTGFSYGIRYNSEDSTWEGYAGGVWGSIGGGAEGSGGEQIFHGSDAVMNNDHTLSNGRNYGVWGPIVLNGTLTLGDGVLTII